MYGRKVRSLSCASSWAGTVAELAHRGLLGLGSTWAQSEAKGDVSAQGFISARCSAESRYSQSIKAQLLQLKFLMR